MFIAIVFLKLTLSRFQMLRIHWEIFTGVLTVVLLCMGCQMDGANKSNNDNNANSLAAVLPSDLGNLYNYEIRPDDLLQIVVQSQPEFSTTRRVAPDGNMYIPILGQVMVVGKRPHVVEAEIREMLVNGYLAEPEVIVIVVEKAKKRFVIIGQVRNPGYYSAPGEMEVTLIEAVAMAGGYTRIAGNIIVTRLVDGQEKKFKLNRKSNNQDASFIILPDDMIEVEESLF